MFFFSNLTSITKGLLVLVVLALAAPQVTQAISAQHYWLNGDAIRLAGADRYETATKVSEYEFGAPASASKIVVASGENFPDALVAGPLASLLNAPLILTGSSGLPEVARQNIQWVFDGAADASPDVFLIGGKNALADSVVAELEAIHPNLDVMRLDGMNRVETALEVAVQFELSQSVPNEVFVVNGNGFADALSASGPASDRGVNFDLSPILLNDSVTTLNPSLRSYFEARTDRIARVHLIGGPAVLDSSLDSQIYDIFAAAGKNLNLDHIVGMNRYETSANVAQVFYGPKNPRSVGVASGEKFPDALVGGQDSGKAFMTNQVQPFVLVQKDGIPEPVRYFLEVYKDSIVSGVIYGGTASVSETVRQQLLGYL